ncbi:hypothetical protein HLB44_02405 [Aquincola sp. S2]|uniref:Cellulose biosynthesis protein BcsS n=1 Tax=Pseudaquabacterium terrae TaxID=2732868 RepID=A0ABX2EBD3_9BURK|nr:hypothetical protein [Aquabacterium terrae]NRF65831.1 hypothetical protein [Aquabacterium terrae]
MSPSLTLSCRLMSVVVAAVVAASAGPAAAEPLQWQGQAALATELTDRGLSVFERRPTLQAELGVSRGRWALGAALSARAADGRDRRVLARLSHYRTLSDDWQLDGGLGYYGYPGGVYARSFNRVEASAGASFRDLLSFNLTALHYRAWRGRRGGLQWAFDAGLRWPLAGAWSLTASLGQADVPPLPQRRYHYGGVGVAWAASGWRVELNRLGADSTAQRLLGETAHPRWSAVVATNF